VGSESQCIDALLNSTEFGQGRARRAHQLKSLAQGGNLKVVEHLGGEVVQRRGNTAEDRITEDSVRALPGGH
jgi:hypothetical protein